MARLFISAYLVFFSLLMAPAAQAADVKDWTFLIYVNGDNELEKYAYSSIAQMEHIGSSPRVNVLVQFDPAAPKVPTSRYLIQKNPSAVAGRITSPALLQLGETNSSDPKVLSDFLTWGIRNYPARHYAVIIWGHGAGWQGISIDNNPKGVMTLPSLRHGLIPANQIIAQQRGAPSAQPQIDILNFDACMMASLEVAFELKDQARILMGSQFDIPGTSEDYEALLKIAQSQPGADPKFLAQATVYQYSSAYSATDAPAGTGLDFIALDLSKIGAFTAAFNAISNVIVSSGAEIRDSMIRAFANPTETQGFDLITGVQEAQKAVQNTPQLKLLFQKFQALYGYPLDRFGSRELNRKSVILSLDPGTLAYRVGTQGPWQQVEMKPFAGFYAAQPQGVGPGIVVDYVIIRPDGTRDAISRLVGHGTNPFVMHTQFPATSPVLADSYTITTRGAHGLSLYALSALQAQAFGHGSQASKLVREYKQLLFSTRGAPAWTQIFGF